MELLTLFETEAVRDGEIYRIEHPHTGRQITILAARLNRRLKSIWIQKDGTISLPAEKSDPPMGYYYPEAVSIPVLTL